mgnify:CR=1 FL=1
MEQLNNTINWARVESILPGYYTVDTSDEDARAYLPLMLHKSGSAPFLIKNSPTLKSGMYRVFQTACHQGVSAA